MVVTNRVLSSLVVVSAVVIASTVVLAMPPVAMAQSAPDQQPAPASKKPDPYQSPLATVLQTRLWTDVPPEQDFVKASRPDPKTVEYAPLVGPDPARPAPRNAAAIAALQAELENGGAKNDAAAQELLHPPAPVPPPATKPPVAAKPSAKTTRRARKPAAKKTTSASAQ